MTPKEYVERRMREGVGKTEAVEEMASVCAASVPSAWRWLRAEERGDKLGGAGGMVCRLLDMWQLLTDEQRAELGEEEGKEETYGHYIDRHAAEPPRTAPNADSARPR